MVKQPVAGRDDLIAAITVRSKLPMESVKRFIAATFGTGGTGRQEGRRNVGVIEEMLETSCETINIRGFGIFRRTILGRRESKIGGKHLLCRRKHKLSFKASPVTDIYED